MESERILSNVVVEMQQDTSPREYLIDPATKIKSIFDNTEQLSENFTTFATDYFVERNSGKNVCTESNIVEAAKWDIKDLGEKFSEILNSAAPDKPYYFHPDYLGGGSMVTDENGAYYQALAYCPFGEDLVSKKATAGSSYNLPYQFTGKEKDDESGFNYFGARYYWSWLGVFISTDPHWYKYPQLSPYNYCANDPINKIDIDGRDIIVLLAPKGAIGFGHMGALVGNKKDGWTYISKDGTNTWYNPVKGKSKYTVLKNINTLYDFVKSPLKKRYTKALVIETTKEQDEKFKEAMIKSVKSDYDIIDNNCADAVSDGLEAAGLDPGTTDCSITYDSNGYTSTDINPIPNTRYEKIKKNNNAISVKEYTSKDVNNE
ncbi:MAG: RHS repeat-associated core domain-containing protein [Prevotellaceae bacterium]|jgi:RHS repeat-associated protein|nr:RHS repeat-associated core domain-containing protein [Prevotellaceae bacterium]